MEPADSGSAANEVEVIVNGVEAAAIVWFVSCVMITAVQVLPNLLIIGFIAIFLQGFAVVRAKKSLVRILMKVLSSQEALNVTLNVLNLFLVDQKKTKKREEEDREVVISMV
jgi:hypothetical protein